uniref:Uncharacterized protein n=1 Tax=Siphoviridae sp. ctZHD14 TaxID=2827891 RepID=A0A8S5SX16_9CAUD|nr:MAG TPA: hypothetical protein [Siphoviridae sp. ctZHD14]
MGGVWYNGADTLFQPLLVRSSSRSFERLFVLSRSIDQ